jgi:hypothetical protein
MPATATAIKQRISDFQEHINRNQDRIRDLGTKAWENTSDEDEVEIVRQYLRQKDCGTVFLNENLAKPILSTSGWTVKFASIFLHQKPKVIGWKKSQVLHQPEKACELGDLQTIFVYVDANRVVQKIRSVIFQAKLKPTKGDYVIEDQFQRRLYDDCDGFRYQSIANGASRDLPRGSNRDRALQYLFVAEKPVRTRTIPSNEPGGAMMRFGEHLVRFLNDSTGLEILPEDKTGTGWNRIFDDIVEEVAREVTSYNMRRNEGLDALLGLFNNFADSDAYYLEVGPESDPGFGIQFVIVSDDETSGEVLSYERQKPVDQLVSFAHAYHHSRLNDFEYRVKQKDRLAERMAEIIQENRISREVCAKLASEPRMEGIVAALAIVIRKSPEPGDADLVMRLLESTSMKHPQWNLLCAAEQLVKWSKFDGYEAGKLRSLLEKFACSEDSNISWKARELSQLLVHQFHSPEKQQIQQRM